MHFRVFLLLFLLPVLGWTQFPVTRMLKVLNWFETDRTDSIYARCDSSFRRTQSPAALSALWNNQVTQYGLLQAKGRVDVEFRENYQLTRIPLFYERAKMQLIVSFNNSQKIVGLYFAPGDHQYEVPAYVDPTSFVEYPIRFGRDPYLLDALLSIDPLNGRSPVVILLQGSGPQDMDGSYGTNKIYKDIAWGLASQGIAVFRYTKRTRNYASFFLGGSSGHYTLEEEYIEDAVMAVNLLRRRNDIDTNRIFILGHAQGASAAIIAAKRSGKVRGVIVASGSPRRMQDLMCEELDYLYGYEPPYAPNRMKADLIKHKLEYSLRPTLNDHAPLDSMPMSLYPSYWLYQNKMQLIDTLNATPNLELLFVHGQRDYHVTRIDFDLWQKHFGNNPHASFLLLPGLNHMYFRSGARSTPAEYEEKHNVDGVLVDSLAAWIKKIPQ